MGGLRICRYKRAETPFFIKRISANVYTMEELCYYICNNFALIDDTLMNEELFSWLETEMAQGHLAGVLRQNASGGASYRKLASLLLDAVGYCNKEELRKLFSRADVKNAKPGSKMLKSVGDRMLDNHKYVKAIREYNSILQLRNRDTQTDEFLGSVYHNMGVAFARLFLYDQAARCFAAAYNKCGDERSKEQYIAAVSLGGEPIENVIDENEPDISGKLEALVKEAAQDDMVKRLRTLEKYKKEGRTEEYEQALSELLQEQKRECGKYFSV